MPNTVKNILLTDEDKCYLNKLLSQSTLEIRVYQRAKILLFKSNGITNETIAVYCIIKLPKVADQNGESCISKLEKNAEAFG